MSQDRISLLQDRAVEYATKSYFRAHFPNSLHEDMAHHQPVFEFFDAVRCHALSNFEDVIDMCNPDLGVSQIQDLVYAMKWLTRCARDYNAGVKAWLQHEVGIIRHFRDACPADQAFDMYGIVSERNALHPILSLAMDQCDVDTWYRSPA